MRVSSVVALVCGIMLAGPVLASAQQTPAGSQEESILGLSVSAPGAIGAMWRTSDAIAIRADLSFSHNKTTDNSSSTTSASGFTIGAAPIFYMQSYDNVRTYVTPRIAYTHEHSSESFTSTVAGSTTTMTGSGSTNGFDVTASFGVEYDATPHWAFFGEAGLGFTHASGTESSNITGSLATLSAVDFTTPSSAPKSNGLGTRAVIGVIFFP